jgi:hypothetical protein
VVEHHVRRDAFALQALEIVEQIVEALILEGDVVQAGMDELVGIVGNGRGGQQRDPPLAPSLESQAPPSNWKCDWPFTTRPHQSIISCNLIVFRLT